MCIRDRSRAECGDLFFYFQFKYIDNIRIRAAEPKIAGFTLRQLTAIAHYVYIRKGHVHDHGTYFSPFGIKIKAVTYFMTSVAWIFAFLIYQRY